MWRTLFPEAFPDDVWHFVFGCAPFVRRGVGSTTQRALGGALMVLVGIAGAAAPADLVVREWTNIHAVPETATVVAYVYLLAVQGAGDQCCTVSDQVRHTGSVEGDDDGCGGTDALGGQG